MAIKASRTLPTVAGSVLMLVIHIRLIVCMAINTFKDGIIGCVNVTVLAVTPLPLMRA